MWPEQQTIWALRTACSAFGFFLSEKTIRRWILNRVVMRCDLLFKGQLHFHTEDRLKEGKEER